MSKGNMLWEIDASGVPLFEAARSSSLTVSVSSHLIGGVIRNIAAALVKSIAVMLFLSGIRFLRLCLNI